MRRIAVHRHGRRILPLNFFRDVDFSVLQAMEQFEEVVGRDFFKDHELANRPRKLGRRRKEQEAMSSSMCSLRMPLEDKIRLRQEGKLMKINEDDLLAMIRADDLVVEVPVDVSVERDEFGIGLLEGHVDGGAVNRETMMEVLRLAEPREEAASLQVVIEELETGS